MIEPILTKTIDQSLSRIMANLNTKQESESARMARNTAYALFDQIIDRVDGWGYIKSKMPEISNGFGTDKFYQILYYET